MDNRSRRARVAQETLEILEAGGYLSPQDQQVSLAEALRHAQENSVLYTPDDFTRVFAERDQILQAQTDPHATRFQVVNATTFAAARQYAAAHPEADVLCLNFASAKNPGGGFLRGSQAQEESLARASGLYPCIAQMTAMYDANRRFGSSLYTDHMIYSPRVPVFRDDEDHLLEEPCCVSILTAPAANAGAVGSNERHNLSRIAPVMLGRILKLLSVAVVHGHRVLILGAWGCGVFKNRPADVADWFYQHLIENERLTGAFESVIFAVLDRQADQATIREFANRFRASSAGV